MAEIEGDFAVFLIGMRLARPWKLHRWLPLALSMRAMLRELAARPETGFLGSVTGLPVSVLYWRSYDHLEAWARDPEGRHWPAMCAFNRKMIDAGGDLGFWHETYLIKDGHYEAVYSGMPPFGLGAAARLVPVTPDRAGARQRLRSPG